VKRRLKRRAIGILAGLLVGGALYLAQSGNEGATDTGPVAGPDLPAGAKEASVERVVDGDTVVLAGLGKVRIIGVDTPEVYGGAECFGHEASEFTKRTLGGARVRYTVGREERDRYGRLLAYLWLADGRSFNALLVARGYAQPLTIPPNDDYASTFVRLSRVAREKHRGLWAPGACPQS
jgi:micrococcal nuclease